MGVENRVLMFPFEALLRMLRFRIFPMPHIVKLTSKQEAAVQEQDRPFHIQFSIPAQFPRVLNSFFGIL
jgi:hypothetical protein